MSHLTAQAATCTESGNAEYWYCTDCGKYFLDAAATTETTLSAVTIAALEHDYSGGVIEPTCTEGGYTYSACTRCGNTVRGDFTSALGHDYVNGSCARCGATDPSHMPDESTGKVIVKEARGCPGDTVSITIALENNPGIITMILEVGYDTSVMTLTGVTDDGILGTAMHTDNLLLTPYQLTWNNGTAPSNFTSVGELAVLTFAIKDTAMDGTYPITLASSGTLNYDLDEVPFTTIGCSVRIEGGAPVFAVEEHHYDLTGTCTVCGHSCPVSCDRAAATVTLSSTPDAAKCILIAAYRNGQLLSIAPGAQGRNTLAVLQADEIRVFYLDADLCPVSEAHRLYA